MGRKRIRAAGCPMDVEETMDLFGSRSCPETGANTVPLFPDGGMEPAGTALRLGSGGWRGLSTAGGSVLPSRVAGGAAPGTRERRAALRGKRSLYEAEPCLPLCTPGKDSEPQPSPAAWCPGLQEHGEYVAGGRLYGSRVNLVVRRKALEQLFAGGTAAFVLERRCRYNDELVNMTAFGVEDVEDDMLMLASHGLLPERDFMVIDVSEMTFLSDPQVCTEPIRHGWLEVLIDHGEAYFTCRADEAQVSADAGTDPSRDECDRPVEW